MIISPVLNKLVLSLVLYSIMIRVANEAEFILNRMRADDVLKVSILKYLFKVVMLVYIIYFLFVILGFSRDSEPYLILHNTA